MYRLQLITGILFTILTGAGAYLFFDHKNNAFLAAAGLFLLIAASCYLLAAGSIRKKRKAASHNPAESDPEETDIPVQPDEAEPEETLFEIENTDVSETEDLSGNEDLLEDAAFSESAETDEETGDSEAAESDDETQETSMLSPFYLAYIDELAPMEQEIIQSNRSASLHGQVIGEMSLEEHETAIEATQIALNALTRLKIFCETKGTGGPEYLEETMADFEVDPEFLTYDELNEQMTALRSSYPQAQEEAESADDALIPEETIYDEEPIPEENASDDDVLIPEENTSDDDVLIPEENTSDNDEAIPEENASDDDVLIPEETASDVDEPVSEETVSDDAQDASEEEMSFPEGGETVSGDTIVISTASVRAALAAETAEAPIEDEDQENQNVTMADLFETDEEVSFWKKFDTIALTQKKDSQNTAVQTDDITSEDGLSETIAESNFKEALSTAYNEMMEDALPEIFAETTDSSDTEEAPDTSETENIPKAPDRLPPFNANDIPGRVLRVIVKNEGIQQSDLIHSFDPSLRKPVRTALHQLMKQNKVVKKRVGLAHGLFLADEKADTDSEE